MAINIVAEISGNFCGDLGLMLNMIHKAKECGCNYVKFQFYEPHHLPDYDPDNNPMVLPAWLPAMFTTARHYRIGLFASVFHPSAVAPLLKFDVPFIKIASPESTRLSLQTYRDICSAVPATTRLIISTGREDFAVMRGLQRRRDLLLYCPPGHPPTITQDDLDYYYGTEFQGFSDHTSGISVPLSFCFPNCMIEKHFKVNENCVDAQFSADPETMALLCELAHNR